MGARVTITVTVKFYGNKTRKQRVRERKTMRYENKTMKSDKPTREKCVFCNEKSRKNKLLHSQRVPSQKVFLIFANEISF